MGAMQISSTAPRSPGRASLTALMGLALAFGTGAAPATKPTAGPTLAPRVGPTLKPATRVATKATAKAAKPNAQPLVIQEISWREFGLVVKASGPIEPDFFTLPKPDRFVIDLPSAELADANLAQTIPVAKGAIKQVRLAQKDHHAVRMVIDCDRPTTFQLMQGGDRSTLIIAPAGANTARLAALLKEGESYTGGGQELRTMWARETKDGVMLHLRGAKGLTYSLFADDDTHLQVRIPQGRYFGVAPVTGKLLTKLDVKRTDSSLTLNVGLAEGAYHLVEEVSKDREHVTLSWQKLDLHRFANRPLIVIDPGHGGADPGALGPNKVPEKEVNLGLALALQKALVAKRYNVVMTRSVDAEVYLAPRLALIDRYHADLFVSLHANSHVTPDSNGVETYWREGVSQPFAEAVQKQVTTILNRPDRGVKQERLYVIRHPRVPSILLETGFISNPYEEILLADGYFQAQAARAIVSGIESFLSAPASAAKGPAVQKVGRAGNTRGS
jgi:N-acetylmuramoyl-L-alanine amidase